MQKSECRKWRSKLLPITGELKKCRKGLHEYLSHLKICPECKKISQEIWIAKRMIGGIGKTRICQKGLHEYPADLASCPKCNKIAGEIYRKTPRGIFVNKTAGKKYRQSSKGKAKIKEYCRAPKRKAWEKAYRQTPKSKAYEASPKRRNATKAWQQSLEGRAWRKEYEQKPERRMAMRAMSAVSNGKRTRIAARGDLTTQQWTDRIEEFDGKCAYCSIVLLTLGDYHHPHYLTMDHIVALLKEGQHTKINVVPACLSCNQSKCNKDVWEWMIERNITPDEKLLIILLEATRLHQKFIKVT